MAIDTFDKLKDALRGLMGHGEDSSRNLYDKVGQAFQRTTVYPILQRQGANKPLFAQTGSLSLTQPLIEQTCFVAKDACVVHAIRYDLPCTTTAGGVALASVTVSTSDNWTIEIRKRPASTYSVGQTIVATLTSNTDSIVPNRAAASIACTLSTVDGVLRLAAHDKLTVRVVKNLLGAQFRGGAITIVTRDGES